MRAFGFSPVFCIVGHSGFLFAGFGVLSENELSAKQATCANSPWSLLKLLGEKAQDGTRLGVQVKSSIKLSMNKNRSQLITFDLIYNKD